MSQAQLVAHLVQVVLDRCGEGISVRSVHLAARLANDVAVEVTDRLADRDSDDDEGDEEHGVGARHDEKPKVGFRPVVGDADKDVERGDARLCVVSKVDLKLKGKAYNGNRADEFLRRLNPQVDNVADEVGRDPDDDHHGDDLHDAHEQEGLAQRHGTVARDRHLCGM